MAFMGVGTRAQTAIFRMPASCMLLLPNGVAVKFGETRNLSSHLLKNSWKTVPRVRFLGDTRGLRVERSGRPAIRSSPQRFFVKAIDVSGPGALDSPLMQSMQTKIQENLNAESVSVRDAYGDGRHVSIDVVASAFEGKSAVNRQRLVYNAIWEELQNKVHAVDQLKTRTPTEVAKSGGQL